MSKLSKLTITSPVCRPAWRGAAGLHVGDERTVVDAARRRRPGRGRGCWPRRPGRPGRPGTPGRTVGRGSPGAIGSIDVAHGHAQERLATVRHLPGLHQLIGNALGRVDRYREAETLSRDTLGEATSVVMPMTWPFMSSSGPPELPGLIAASVWIMGWL